MTAAVASPTGEVLTRGALDHVRAVLQKPTRMLTAALLDYYSPDNDECGTSFLDGSEIVSPEAVTAADLFAVTTLGLRVAPSTARRLLRDTPHAADIASCLAPSRLPLDATLAEAGPELLAAMTTLHDSMVSAVGARPDADAYTVATALCARKRPELFPVLDSALCSALALPPPSTPCCGA
jgi:hypothetical protein